jgi:hypothetical protein
MITGVMIATTAGFLAFAFMKFPDSLLVIIPSVALCVAAVFLVQRKEKAARFNVYYATVQQFGKPVSFGNLDAAFERDGTRFDARFPRGKYSLFFTVSFYIPNSREKFSIQNRNFHTTHHDDCQIIGDAGLPPEYLLQSRNPAFLPYLLSKRQIRDEVLNYGASFWGRTSISFDDGAFELIWTPPVSEQIDGFYKVCQTAVVFHDELRKISGR